MEISLSEEQVKGDMCDAEKEKEVIYNVLLPPTSRYNPSASRTRTARVMCSKGGAPSPSTKLLHVPLLQCTLYVLRS